MLRSIAHLAHGQQTIRPVTRGDRCRRPTPPRLSLLHTRYIQQYTLLCWHCRAECDSSISYWTFTARYIHITSSQCITNHNIWDVLTYTGSWSMPHIYVGVYGSRCQSTQFLVPTFLIIMVFMLMFVIAPSVIHYVVADTWPLSRYLRFNWNYMHHLRPYQYLYASPFPVSSSNSTLHLRATCETLCIVSYYHHRCTDCQSYQTVGSRMFTNCSAGVWSMLQLGIIRPSSSNWSLPLHMLMQHSSLIHVLEPPPVWSHMPPVLLLEL